MKIIYLLFCFIAVIVMIAGCKSKEEPTGENFAKEVETGNINMVRLFIEKGIDVNVKDRTGRTALMKASAKANAEMVRLLIEKGAKINVKDNKGRTALMEATGMEDIDIVRLLIEKGADINAKDDEGYTSLWAASFAGNVEIAKLLIERGADVNAQNNEGYTALMFALLVKKNFRTVNLLIEKGADVNLKNNDGNTALMVAVFNKDTDMVRLLIEKGADVNLINNKGKTAFKFAEALGNYEIADLLQKASAFDSGSPLYKLGNEKGLSLLEKYRDSIRNRVKENCIKEMKMEHINYDRDYIAGCVYGYEHSAFIEDNKKEYHIVGDEQSKGDKKLDFRKKTLTDDDLKKYR